ncbi:MAG: cysteine hydrolase [Acidimicrobiia bacterium]
MALDPSFVVPSKTAIVINEAQRGVVGDLTSLPMAAEAARDAVGNIGRLVRLGRKAGVQVIHCVAMSREDGKGANTNTIFAGRRRKDGEPTPDVRAHAQVVPEIGVEPEDFLIERIHGMTPMSDTEIDPILRNMGISTVIAAGGSLNVGVLGLVFEAMNKSYTVVVPRDAVWGVPKEYGDLVLQNSVRMMARLTSVDELAEIWSAAT